MASPILTGQSQTVLSRAWDSVRRWWLGRDWRAFRPAAPAAIVALGILFVVVVCATQSPRELEARYLAQGKAALQAKDYPRALTCFERVSPTANDPDAHYRLALAAAATGDYGRASALIHGLAPDGRPGYAPAHYWRARQLLASSPEPNLEKMSPALRARAESHLVRALDGDLGADRPAALGLMGQLHLVAGRLEAAEQCLVSATSATPMSRLYLAQLYLKKTPPDLVRARKEADLAVGYFRDRTKDDLNNYPARLSWAAATAFLEDFSSAVAILEEGLSATGAPIFRAAIAKTYVGWYDVRKKQNAPANELIALLAKGIGHEPGSRELLDRILYHLQVGGADADQARGALRDLLASGTQALAHVHFALAVDARMRNDHAAEKMHLELALAADPQAAVVANNLACALMEPPHSDLPRALATVNVALGREPGNPVFLDTRGRIYLGLKRWQDAITDLDAVLTRAPGTEGIHAALASAYDGLGQTDLAEKYRRQVPNKSAPKP
ncbi:hypothetical protein R5W24_001244 [Gemmata sp. JC717]|uniref:tetratricopeptide repeat protein n=1 Tax=Gemmata algarum TaxID=2975278 RepID=UPI0021BB906F|nr:tetratricopeptide repeat protein [Gemmata algarum]MDY3552164.1 hypothetical protein [Gemmata algarum]